MPNEWINENYRTIQITDGADASDSTLINWLENNATELPADMGFLFTELPGYAALSAGPHPITLKATATGYTDSPLSAVVSITKLAVPANDSISGTTLSFDSVTGASSYAIIASDGTSTIKLGQYTPA